MLKFVPTPIGNLGDISLRSLEAINESDIIICEDTRESIVLIEQLANKYPSFFSSQNKNRQFISLYHHNSIETLSKLDISIFEKNIIYMSDAGMPGISDPGIDLVNFAKINNIKFEVLPGATALTVASLSSGFADKKILFWGFLPHKGKDRELELSQIINSSFTTIIYESPHRIEKLANELSLIAKKREIFFTKELTKKFEGKWWSFGENSKDLLTSLDLRGEWVVVIKGEDRKNGIISEEDILNLSISTKEKSKLIAKIRGENQKEIYSQLISN